jgi:3-hydroxyisobutyrate dehydrogenase-like beta-hydroxyacid dehydrogenase
MSLQLALIGFGEAAQAFATGSGWTAHAFDIEQDSSRRSTLQSAAAAAGVGLCDTLAEALAGSPLVLSLVTADAALAVARAAAPLLDPGALFLDMNSVAPDTKRDAAILIEAAGARYADVAVMAPVLPARRAVPLLVAGPAAAMDSCTTLGFSRVAQVGEAPGRAAAIKLCRSVIVKGTEALTAEALLAADRAGVLSEVVAALGEGWEPVADYHLDRMLVHGQRRGAEMAEAARMLRSLGLEASLAAATAAQQQALGSLDLCPPPDGLASKLAAIRGRIG